MQPETPQDDEIDLLALGATIWAGKRWIAGAVSAALLISAVYLVITPPTYQADALLQLEAGKNSLALPESMSDLLGGNAPSTLAEIEIIKSRQILGRAVAELNLDWQVTPILPPIIGMITKGTTPPSQLPTVVLGYLQVPPNWINQEIRLTKTGDKSYLLTLPDGSAVNGVIDTVAANAEAGFAINVRQMRGDINQSYSIVHSSELASIKSLAGALSISERGQKTGILELTFRHGDIIAAQSQLNAIIRAYVEQNIMKSAAEAQKGLDFISTQLPLAQQALSDAEKALNDYRAAQKSVDLAFETQSLLSETTAIEGKLRELRLQEEELKQKYTANHPVYRQLLEQRDALLQRLADLQLGISELPETQREVINLTRNLELTQAAYFELMNRSQELRVLSASQIGSARVIDDAAPQVTPVAPRKSLIVALALVMGMMVGIVIVLIRNWMRRGIDSVQEIERIGVAVFATINLYSNSSDTKITAPLVAISEPEHIVVEALRSLRTSLHFGMLDGNNKSLVLTSSAPGAGKSFIAGNLAVVAAQAGQKVCLIDADMRRGTLRKYFDLPRSVPGLSGYLAEAYDISGVLRHSGIENLSLIMTGPIPPNPSELLMRHRMAELIDTLDQDFDLIIFDAPPVLAVTDAVIIGRAVGSVISVVRHDITPIGELASVRRTLEGAGVTLKGAIFNAYDPSRARGGAYGYGYGYGYGYSNQYSYKSDRT